MIKTQHPDYENMSDEWVQCLDVKAGPKAVKPKTTEYLPVTQGMRVDDYGIAGSVGTEAYSAYIKRAYMPNDYSVAVRKILGVMHKNQAEIKLPKSMESLYTDADGTGTTIYELLREINDHQLSTGRLAILGDIKVKAGKVKPVIKLYPELTVPNWGLNNDNQTDFAILDESGPVLSRDTFKYDNVKQFRVLRLLPNEKGEYVYHTATTQDEGADINELKYIAPNAMGQTLSELPFCFCNADNTRARVSAPPMAGLKELVLSIYRASADYKQSLFNMSQETLVVSGLNFVDEDEDIRIGPGSVIKLQTGGKADFIGANSKGLPEQRQAIGDDYDRASNMSTSLAVQSASSRDSAESLSLRVENMSAAFSAVAIAGAASLEHVLRAMAPLFGVKNPEEISVVPNLEFSSSLIDGDQFIDMQAAKNSGYPISQKSLHALAVTRGATTKTYEQEMAEIAEEEPSDMGSI